MLSLILRGCTSYVQVLDVLINKLIKTYIKEYEDLQIKENFDLQELRKWLLGDRRVLLIEQVIKAFKRVYLEHKDAIITCFKNVGLSLAVDGSEDHLLKIQDLPNITVRDQEKAPDRIEENPTIIDDDVLDIIEVDDNKRGLLYTVREVVEGITIKEEDKNDVTIDLGVESVDRFDPNKDDESDFDDVIDGDKDKVDKNMQFYYLIVLYFLVFL